jgi:hypothetical protein
MAPGHAGWEDDMGIVVRVELTSGRGNRFDPPPGRELLVFNHHSFRQLALAIDLAFGRWDLSHLHAFDVPGRDRRLGFAFEADDGEEDDSRVRPGRILKRGDTFRYEFDYGDSWIHDCTVTAVRVSERDMLGDGSLPLPDLPVVTFGWGSLPDQYGRSGAWSDDETETDDDAYPEDLEDVATLMARATTAHGRHRDEDAIAMLQAWIRDGHPPRIRDLEP